MKKLFLLLILQICLQSNAQTLTEKYNSIMNRYEYFDSEGKLVGYKVYDNLGAQWKYYDSSKTKNNPTNSYIQPINLNLLNKSLSSIQQRYNLNTTKVQEAINDIATRITNLKLEADTYEIVKFRFDKSLEYLNSQKFDYTKNVVTQNAIKYLYDQVNNEINFQLSKNNELNITHIRQDEHAQGQNINPQSEKAKHVEKERLKAMQELEKFYGGYKTNLVTEEVFNINNSKLYDILNEDKTTTKFYFQNSHLYFLRSQYNQWLGSSWVWFITEPNFYIMFDNYNQLISISKDFRTITFYANKVGNNYMKRYVYHNLQKDLTVIPIKE